MKKTILYSLVTFTIVCSAADPPAKPAPAAVPVVDAQTQIDLLAHQLVLMSARASLKDATDAADKAQADAQVSMKKAEAQCGDKYAPSLKDHQVVCTAKAIAPAPPVSPKPDAK